MSSFNNLFNRVKSLNEAFDPAGSKSLTNTPDAFTGLRGKLKLAGMKATSRDAMLYITRVLSRTDIITSAEHDHTIKGQHKDRWDKLFAILKDKADEINERSDEIVEFMKKDLDIFTDEIGVNRGRADGEGRSELYAAQAEVIKNEIDDIETGKKEADEGLEDIMKFVGETIHDMSMMKADSDTEETGPVRAAIDGVMKNLRKEAVNDPDSFPPYVIEDLEEFVTKIMTLEQYKSFVKQLAEFSKEDQYYEKPVVHFMDQLKQIEDGIARNIASEDNQEFSFRTPSGEKVYKSGSPGLDSLTELVYTNRGKPLEWYIAKRPNLSKYERRALERLMRDSTESPSDRQKRLMKPRGMTRVPAENNESDNREHGSVEEHYPEEKDPRTAGGEMNRDSEEESVKQEVLDACKEHAIELEDPTSSGMAKACNDMYNQYGEEGDQEKAEIAYSLQKYYETQSKFDSRKNSENIEDYEGNEGIEDYETVNVTTERYQNQQHLNVSTHSTSMYLTEQTSKDKRNKKQSVNTVSFKERYKPKTSQQLDELRRYGL